MYNVSPDGDMKPKNSGTDRDLHNIVYNGNTWVAIGDADTLVVSTDNGNSWTTKSGTYGHLHNIVYNGNTWVAIGDAGALVVSTDNGNSWTKKNTGTDGHLFSIAYNGNTWVAVGGLRTGVIVTSTDNGNSWTTKIGSATPLYRVACNGVIFVAVGANGAILSSADAVQWK